MKLDFEEKTDFSRRQRDALGYLMLICPLLFLLFLLVTPVYVDVVIVTIIFCVQFFRQNNLNRYYITQIAMERDGVIIVYKDKLEEKHVVLTVKNVQIRMSFLWAKSRVPYLTIHNRNDLVLRQFLIGDWTEDDFELILQELRKLKILQGK